MNRVSFGGVEEVDPITGKGFGMLSSKDAMGKLIFAAQDRKILKKSKQKAAKFFQGTGNASVEQKIQLKNNKKIPL
jgi:hypothetical protein